MHFMEINTKLFVYLLHFKCNNVGIHPQRRHTKCLLTVLLLLCLGMELLLMLQLTWCSWNTQDVLAVLRKHLSRICTRAGV